jgi:hypothetical protein
MSPFAKAGFAVGKPALAPESTHARAEAAPSTLCGVGMWPRCEACRHYSPFANAVPSGDGAWAGEHTASG